jgi:hypothetical protein
MFTTMESCASATWVTAMMESANKPAITNARFFMGLSFFFLCQHWSGWAALLFVCRALRDAVHFRAFFQGAQCTANELEGNLR